MTCSRTKTPLSRRLVQLAFAVALLTIAGRVVQLARMPADNRPFMSSAPGFAGESSSARLPVATERRVVVGPLFADIAVPATTSATSADLSELYTHCPMAAVVDLDSVAESPEKVDALLPPFRPTADRVPVSRPSPAVPRIRYPVTLRPSAPALTHPADALRIARVPKETSPAPAASEAKNDWLIDPSQWYITEERTPPPTVPAATPAPTAAAPPAADETPHAPPSQNNSWKLVTPDGEPAPGALPPIPRQNPEAPLTAPDLELPTSGAKDSESPSPAPAAKPVEAVPVENDIQQAPATAPFGPPSSPTGAFDAPPQLSPQELTLPSPPTPPTTPKTTPSPPTPVPPAEVEDEALPPAPQAADVFAPPTAPAAPPQVPVTTTPSHTGAAAPPTTGSEKCVDPHLALFAKNNYPSARECAACHEDIYHEWSISAHAYAAVSPMFHKFEQKLNDVSQGTVGYFCMRCHAPVATALGASRAEPLWNLPEVAREGITCIACHRVQYIYGKSNGERRIEPGDIFAPVLGGIGGDGIAHTIQHKDEYKVKTSPDQPGPGQDMHLAGIYVEPLTKSEFCTPCHQVAVHPGIKLEVVWEQYRASPACKKGIQCQDCHMGRVPGLPLGYNCGPVARIVDKTVNDQRRKSNHVFFGPNYSIAHPGVFPFHLKANRWNIEEWLAFDWRAGWGTDEFEDRIADGSIQANFPPVWAEADDRYDAREIINENLKKLNHKRDLRVEVMENGSHVDGPFFDSPPCRGADLHLHYIITNTNEGHNLLTASLGAQPQLWANIVLVGPDGRRLWETGYTDSFGDLCNIHSHDVRHHKMPYDWQLFNLQSMFLITGAKGTDREFFVPVNVDIDQLPFIRPGVQPISVLNHPPFIRMESQSLAPLGARRVPYRIPGELLQQPGTYRLSFRMRSRAEPIYFMQFCGATDEMQRSMNEWMIDIHPSSIEFTIP